MLCASIIIRIHIFISQIVCMVFVIRLTKKYQDTGAAPYYFMPISSYIRIFSVTSIYIFLFYVLFAAVSYISTPAIILECVSSVSPPYWTSVNIPAVGFTSISAAAIAAVCISAGIPPSSYPGLPATAAAATATVSVIISTIISAHISNPLSI